jgi:hypothetical protein
LEELLQAQEAGEVTITYALERWPTTVKSGSQKRSTPMTVSERRLQAGDLKRSKGSYCVKMRWIIKTPAADLKAIKPDESVTLPLLFGEDLLCFAPDPGSSVTSSRCVPEREGLR